MATLGPNPTLKDFQTYIWEMEKERGFETQTVLEKCLLLGEEVGELFKSIRSQTNIAIDRSTEVSPVAEELADVLIMLLSVANHSGVDLEAAFRKKEEKNDQRVWASSPHQAGK